MNIAKKSIKQATISSLIITIIASAFNLYQRVSSIELIKMAIIVFFVWLIILFFLLLLIRIKKL